MILFNFNKITLDQMYIIDCLQQFDNNQINMNYCQILHLIALLLLPYQMVCLTTVPTFQIIDKYVQTGTYTVTTLGVFYNNSAWMGVDQTTFNIPYSRNQSSPSTQVSFQQLNFKIDPFYVINITINVCSNTSTNMVVCMYSNSLNNLYTLRIRYIAISPLFNKIALYTLSVNPSSAFINSTSPYLTTISLPSTNITGTIRTFLAFIGFNVSAFDSNLQFDLKASASFLSTTTIQLKIQTVLVNNIALYGASFAYIGYSEQVAASWPFPSAKLNFIIFSGGGHSNAFFFDSNNIVRDFNTFWGLTRININNQINLHFTSDIFSSPVSMIQGKSNYPFNYFDFNLVIFIFKQCDASTPYYMMSTDICYDVCPARYYQDNSTYLCQPCIYSDCYKCLSNGSCTVCNATVQFRTLNTATSRCDMMTGYFSGSGGAVSSCNGNCYTCSLAATNCTSCFSGYFVDATNQCSPCIANCQACSTSTTCSTCNIYYALDNASTCVSTVNCSAILNCQTCNVPSGCTQCILGYSTLNIITCVPVCGDGIKLSFQGCDDNNNNNGDGCSSNCTIEPRFYCTGSDGNLSICGQCTIHCSSCTAADDCQACDSPYLLNATTNCLPNCSLIVLCLTCHEPIGFNYTVCDSCSYGYQPINNTCSIFCGDSILVSPEQCDDGNLIDGDGCSSSCNYENNSICSVVSNKSVCSFCSPKFYARFDHLVCLACSNYECLTCNSSGLCLTCNATANRILNSTTSRCIPIDGFYDDGANQLALLCSIDCITCKGGTSASCLSCPNSTILINNYCVKCQLVAGIGCSVCDIVNSTFICTSCNSTIINGTCSSSINLQSLINLPKDPLCDILLTVILPMLLTLLCLCCLCLMLLCRRRRNEENKVNEQAKQLDLNNELKMDNKREVRAEDTEGNELSIDQFKDLGSALKEHADKQKSVLNKCFDMKSEISRQQQKRSNEGESRGDVY